MAVIMSKVYTFWWLSQTEKGWPINPVYISVFLQSVLIDYSFPVCAEAVSGLEQVAATYKRILCCCLLLPLIFFVWTVCFHCYSIAGE